MTTIGADGYVTITAAQAADHQRSGQEHGPARHRNAVLAASRPAHLAPPQIN